MQNENNDDDEGASYTPQRSPRPTRRRQRSRSLSSDDSDARPVKRSRTGLTADDLMKILSAMQSVPSKTNNANNVVPEFDPDNKAQDVERWLRKVDECAEIYTWDQKQTVHYALQKLRGKAKDWYVSLPSLNYSWDVWRGKLMKAFPNDVNYGKLLDEMLNRRARTDETLRDYFYEKLSLVSRCEIVGRKAVDCIIYGITDNSVRNGAQALKCEEPEDLLNYLSSQQSSNSKEHTRGSWPINSVKRREFRSNTYGRNPSSSKGTDIVCFNCNERGHIYQNCSKPITKCEKCHRVGHNIENCNRRPLQTREVETKNQGSDKKVLKVIVDKEVDLSSNNAGRDVDGAKAVDNHPTHAIPLSNSINNGSNDKFHKNVCVNGAMLNAYIDFGSDCSLIRCSDAKSLDLIERKDHPLPTIKGFGNSTVIPKFQSTVGIRIDEIDTKLDVLVVDDVYLHVPLLIGQNFTEMTSVTVMKDNEKLFFYHTPSDVLDRQDKALSLYVSKDVTINRGGLVEVYTKEAYTGDIYSDGGTRMSPNQEYHLRQGCYRVDDSKAVIFR